MSCRLALKYLPNLAVTVKYFQTSCAKYSAAAAAYDLRTSSHLTSGSYVTSTAVVRDASNALSNPPSCLEKSVKLSRFVDVTEKDELECRTLESSHAIGTVELTASTLGARNLKDVAPLFPDRTLSDTNLTAVSICLRTKQDMSVWNKDVEMEREQLHENYMQSSIAICEALRANGFWADFIDTSCGKPYLSEAHTNTTLFETDYLMTRLAGNRLTINDLGCCRVVEHVLWGCHVYVGMLFTDAPKEHPVLSGMQA